jgi:protein-disulfide isomerase
MKKIYILWTLLLCFLGTQEALGNPLPWSQGVTWQVDSRPLDLVHSLDNRLVFVLGADARVTLYSLEGRRLGSIPVDPSTVALEITPRGETLYLVDRKNNYKVLNLSYIQNIDTTGAPFQGPEQAPVHIVVFSDFQCPFCNRVHPMLKQVMNQYPGRIKIFFKHMPLGMHQEAEPAARASIAAQQQGKFWEMHDALFANRQLNNQSIEQAAAQIGLDIHQFRADWNSPATQQKLTKDINDARLAEVYGTPILFVNGRRVQTISLEAIQSMVAQELSKR